ncbi:MAG: hypothetical protein GC156_06560 [Actinomycetales bacterium]|nr:hypothetical protein [Actinomycetales bacterium]
MKRTLAPSILLVALLAAGCSGANEAGVTSEPGATSATSLSSTSGAPGDGIAIGGTDLPEGWPADLPAYPGGTVLSATVLDGGETVNATWSSDDPADTAWATVDSALRAKGFVPVSELGEESQFIQDDTQTTDTYRSDTYEVNMVVVAGEQTTIFLNASRLG